MDWMSKAENYKQLHEHYMQNHSGSTVFETVIVTLHPVIGIFMSPLLALYFPLLGVSAGNSGFSYCILVTEFLILVLPSVLCITIWSDISFLILNLMLILSVCLVTVYQYLMSENVYTRNNLHRLFGVQINDKKRHFVTNFRVVCSLLTAICILGVDFTVFPRRFAKTENFGYGLMDTGVGSFIISNAIVAPETRKHNTRCRTISAVLFGTIKGCTPLILLGCVRFLLVKQIDYQEHVTEYGVHWNFFITLALTKLVCSCIFCAVDPKASILLAGFVIGVHELLLTYGVRDWVLSNVPRATFLTANREGIASSLGYVAIYFGGISLGCLLQTDESLISNVVLLFKLAGLSVVLWYCTKLSEHWFGVSRRLANSGYFWWMLAHGVTLLTLLLLAELLTCVIETLYQEAYQKSKSVKKLIIRRVPFIVEAISKNGLAFFLLANIFTGIINIFIYTLYVKPISSVLIITGYMFTLCTVSVIAHVKKVQLKFW